MGLLLFFRFLSLHQGPESLRLGLHLVNGTGLLIGIMGDEALGDESFVVRSEEHTSELQSLMRISYAVFCLKKKTISLSYPTCSHSTATSLSIQNITRCY